MSPESETCLSPKRETFPRSRDIYFFFFFFFKFYFFFLFIYFYFYFYFYFIYLFIYFYFLFFIFFFFFFFGDVAIFLDIFCLLKMERVPRFGDCLHI